VHINSAGILPPNPLITSDPASRETYSKTQQNIVNHIVVSWQSWL